MNPKQKWLLAGVLLLIFAASKLWLLQWWQQQQPAVEQVQCDVQAGCRLPNGAVLTFGETLGVQTPFDVRVEQVDAAVQQVAISFSMKDMDMGFNRYDLRLEQGVWWGRNIRLPLCTESRHDFLADIQLDKQVYQVEFVAK